MTLLVKMEAQLGMDSASLSARAKQPGNDRSFRRSETSFVSALRQILAPDEWVVAEQPGDLRHVLGGHYGVLPDAMIRFRATGRPMYFEVKKQGRQGNAEERAYKHHTVRFYEVLHQALGLDYHPYVTVMCDALATEVRYTTKFPYLMEEDHYFCWVDYDVDLLADFISHIADQWLMVPDSGGTQSVVQ